MLGVCCLGVIGAISGIIGIMDDLGKRDDKANFMDKICNPFVVMLLIFWFFYICAVYCIYSMKKIFEREALNLNVGVNPPI